MRRSWILREGLIKRGGKGSVESSPDPAQTNNTQQTDQSDDSGQGERWGWLPAGWVEVCNRGGVGERPI